MRTVPVVLSESVRPCFFEFESADVFRRGLSESRFLLAKMVELIRYAHPSGRPEGRSTENVVAAVSAFKFVMADSDNTTGIVRFRGTI